VPYITQTAIGLREKLMVYGDDYDTPDGSCIRDYINVVDLAKAHVIAVNRMLNKKLDEDIEYFNIGTGKGMSVLELVNLFQKATGVELPYEIVGRDGLGFAFRLTSDARRHDDDMYPQFIQVNLTWCAPPSLEPEAVVRHLTQ
jgi:UDP-glucose 4-epimerase